MPTKYRNWVKKKKTKSYINKQACIFFDFFKKESDLSSVNRELNMYSAASCNSSKTSEQIR